MPTAPSRPRGLLIRADASVAIGTGHVMRCLALAQRWRRAGGEVRFAQAQTTPAVTERIRAAGFEPVLLDAEAGEADADATANAALAFGAAWVVADGYGFDARWQRRLKQHALSLCIVDDYGHSDAYFADLILNQNPSAEAAWYARRPPGSSTLLGSKFALLRSEFLSEPRPAPAAVPVARKIVVTFGGSDAAHATAKAIEALRSLAGVEIRVIVGGSNPDLPALREAIKGAASPVELVADAADMPRQLAWADLAIASASSTCWELAYLGVPAILIVCAANQLEIAKRLAADGVAVNLGWHGDVDPAAIGAAVRARLADAQWRGEAQTRARAMVDGHGASRVAAALGAPLRLTLLSDRDTWLNAYLPGFAARLKALGHEVRWTHSAADLGAGDVAFWLSCAEIVPAVHRAGHAHNLVVHESALPAGRGWSPLTWQILEGKQAIPITLFEASDRVDRGDIYADEVIALSGGELIHELRAAQAAATFRLCLRFLAQYPSIAAQARKQAGTPSSYRRRTPEDSRLDPDRTLREQFNLLRVADPDRYPAFFELAGRRYRVRITAEASEPASPLPAPLRDAHSAAISV